MENNRNKRLHFDALNQCSLLSGGVYTWGKETIRMLYFFQDQLTPTEVHTFEDIMWVLHAPFPALAWGPTQAQYLPSRSLLLIVEGTDKNAYT